LELCERLFPLEKYPQGHPELGQSLEALSRLATSREDHASILSFHLRRLETAERLYPRDRYPQGHPVLAASLSSCGKALCDHGDYGGASTYFRRSLEINERLCPPDRYPRGHTAIAVALSNLGSALLMQNDFTQSLNAYQASLHMLERLYPSEEFPQGHAYVAEALRKVGAVYMAVDSSGQALRYYQRALQMMERLYPKDRFPQGHDDLITCLQETANVQQWRGDLNGAFDLVCRAREMLDRLHPPGRSPEERRLMNGILLELGNIYSLRGDLDQALNSYRQVLALHEQLYPPDRYPHGHYNMAVGLHNLGMLLETRGDLNEAMALYRRALTMLQGLSSEFAASASEAEALNFEAGLPMVHNCLMSLNQRLPRPDPHLYGLIWDGKASVTRIVQRRQRALFLACDPEARVIGRELAATRLELAQLALTPTGTAQSLRLKLEELTRRKEDLERRWTARLPDRLRQDELASRSAADLAGKLPRDAVFIDFVAYSRHQHGPSTHSRNPHASYLAFVLWPGQAEVASIDLGLAEPIDRAISAWREEIAALRAGPAANTLRRLIWEPLDRLIPAGTWTVWIAPDGELSRIPWGAIPGREPGGVLLEDYAIALVPHGPFLLDQVTANRRSDKGPARLLAVGDVDYDHDPAADPSKWADQLASHRSPPGEEDTFHWPALPGTRAELGALMAIAGGRPAVRLSGAEASIARVLEELPRTRLAHLATHGFFADPKFRSTLHLDESAFLRGYDRDTPGARNPLVLSGLVLAGANRPIPTNRDGLPLGNGGILTAEAIAGLPLQGLELVVLSACETGLGEIAGREGVFGLQRAFHMAGARDVVASFWRVDDQATAAVMAIFYDQLWRQGKPPIEALRTAQLTLYYHPEQAAELAQARGTPDFGKLVQRPKPVPSAGGTERSPKDRAPVKQWAAFVLSGWGQ
jgi:CHAT domain-containing protein/tetratricopeptide (TPR) repeat protein